VSSARQELPLQKFYDTELLEVPKNAEDLLERYSKIPRDEILAHILETRNKAWKTFPHPSIGRFQFLDLQLAKSPIYKDILERIQHGQQFLDLGCCFGQELRQLVSDGAKSENLYGVELHSEFFDFGYELFRDKDHLNALFLEANIFSHESVIWQLQGKIDIIWVGAFLHLFDRHHQLIAIKHMLRLLSKQPSSIIVGRLVGSETPGEYPSQITPNGTVYTHDVHSFKKMFHEAAEAMDAKWETDVHAKPWEGDLKLKASEDEPVSVGLLDITFVARKLERLDMPTSHHYVF